MWGDPSYALRDLNGDGVPELVSADDRFAYAFTSYAGSALPVQAWRYRAGHMTDVTRSFPALVRKDAAMLWKGYEQEPTGEDVDVRGVLAAWMADQYLLGQQDAGWTTLHADQRAGRAQRRSHVAHRRRVSGQAEEAPHPAGLRRKRLRARLGVLKTSPHFGPRKTSLLSRVLSDRSGGALRARPSLRGEREEGSGPCAGGILTLLSEKHKSDLSISVEVAR